MSMDYKKLDDIMKAVFHRLELPTEPQKASAKDIIEATLLQETMQMLITFRLMNITTSREIEVIRALLDGLELMRSEIDKEI